jgi:hypothetical protein
LDIRAHHDRLWSRADSDKISGSQQIAENGDTIDMDTLNLDMKGHGLGMKLQRNTGFARGCNEDDAREMSFAGRQLRRKEEAT